MKGRNWIDVESQAFFPDEYVSAGLVASQIGTSRAGGSRLRFQSISIIRDDLHGALVVEDGKGDNGASNHGVLVQAGRATLNPGAEC